MKIIDHPQHFKEGVRILMRVLRNKDGGKGNVDRHSKKLVSRNPEEFDKNLEILLSDMQTNERIYSTVDARDTSKAIRRFKLSQLENDYNPNPEGFYIDIYNRWISSLQQPSARASSFFLFDCDTVADFSALTAELEAIGIEEEDSPRLYTYRYHTKNGGHIITQPFPYPKMIDVKWHPLLHKNAMMLWVY